MSTTKSTWKIARLVTVAVAAIGTVWWYAYHNASSRAPSPETPTARESTALPAPLRQVAAQNPGTGQTVWPTSLQAILAESDLSGYRPRDSALRAIKRDLMPEETDALMHYLLSPAGDARNRKGEEWLRNDIMDKLANQTALPAGFPDVLLGVFQNHGQDPVLRDYAVQYMPFVFNRANADEKTTLTNALWQAVGETNTSIAGTALLALLQLAGGPGSATASPSATLRSSGSDPVISRGQLAQTAFKLAADDHCGELARITAVQVCGRLHMEEALPVIEQLAQSGPTMPLRIAATAALGDLGDPAMTNVLHDLAVNSDPRQILAATSALHRLGHGNRADGDPAGGRVSATQ